MDKTEAQIEREKTAVAAMANAKSNMATALDRIATLEQALKHASHHLGQLKYHVGDHSKIDMHDNRPPVFVKTYIGDAQAAITKVLP